MPIPSALLVKNGSKTSFNLSSGTPAPRSDTDSSATFSTRQVLDADDAIFAPHVPHRVDPVHDKVQNHLLKLDAVAEDRKRVRCDRTCQFDLSSNGERRKKFDGFPRDLVEVDVFELERCLFQEAAHPPDDFGGAPVIKQNITHDFLEFSDIGAR